MSDDPIDGLTSPEFIVYDRPWFLVYAGTAGTITANNVVRQSEDTPEFGPVSVVHMYTDSDLARRGADHIRGLGVDVAIARLTDAPEYAELLTDLSRAGATHVAFDPGPGASRIAADPITDVIVRFRRWRRR